jgi:DNA-binding NarL/FixJ family response regulator
VLPTYPGLGPGRSPRLIQRGEEIVSETVPESHIRVYLLHENRLLGDALRRLFRKRGDLQVVGSEGKEDCRPQRLLEIQCDVLVLDFFDPRWLPVNLQEKTGNNSSLRVLLIGMSNGTEQFLAAVRGGVAGYLLKEASTSEVVGAVRSMFKGEAVCPAELCGSLFQYVRQMARRGSFVPNAVRPDLTLRQQQLAALVARGLTNKEIAAQLNLSEYTVKNHVRRIMKQMDAGSRSQAVETILAHGYALNFYEGNA